MQIRVPATLTFFAGTLALLASSNAATFGAIDANGDGTISPMEFVAAYPMSTNDDFDAADVDADGLLSIDEHARAVESGILPAG